MPRVSLIVLRPAGLPWPSGLLAACRAGLEESGHGAEVIVVSDPTACPSHDLVDPWCDSIEAPNPGISAAAVSGIQAARGEVLAVLDASRGYAPEDVIDVVDRLLARRQGVVVAASPRGIVGTICHRLFGTADPFAGLVALCREGAIEADPRFAPVGSRFAIEILARVAGPRVDVAVSPVGAGAARSRLLDDVRLAKRLADDRFGTISRLVQFCFVGASGMAVDLTCYALFQALLSRTALANLRLPLVDGSIDLAASAILAIALALTWNFSLNRRLTFNDARRGSVGAQYLRYALSNLLGIGVSLTLRLALPGAFGFFARHRLAAAVTGIVAATGISFAMARWFVFGRKSAQSAPPVPEVAKARAVGFRVRPDRGGTAPAGSLRERVAPSSNQVAAD